MAGRRALSSNDPSKKGKQVAPRLPPIFPFGLPFVPLDKIFRAMSLLDLIKFSLISERCRNLIEDNFTIRAELLKLEHRRRLSLRLPGNQYMSFDFRDSRTWIEKRNYIMRKNQTSKVWGVEMVMWQEYLSIPNFTVLYFYSEGDRDRFYALFVRFVVKVFRPKTTVLESRFDVEKDSVFSILRQSPLSKVRALEISWLNPNTIILPELQELLGYADQLRLRVYLPKLKYTGPINPRKLEVTNASWLTVESLKQMRCEQLEAKGTMLTAEDINGFLKHWKQEGYAQDLNFCCFFQHERFWIDPESDEKMGKVLEGLEAIEGIPATLVPANPARTWYFKLQSGDLVTMRLDKKRLKFVAWNTERLGSRDMAKFFFEDLGNYAAFHDD